MLREKELVKVDYENGGLKLSFRNIVVAEINTDITINLDYINNIRSTTIKKEIFKVIYENSSFMNTEYSEDTYFIVLNVIYSSFEINKEELLKLYMNEPEFLLKVINSLIYVYSNVWHSTRVVYTNSYYNCFENNSLSEMDIILSIIIKEDNEFLLKVIEKMPNVKLINKEEFLKKAKMIKIEMLDSTEEMYDNSNYISNIEDVFEN